MWPSASANSVLFDEFVCRSITFRPPESRGGVPLGAALASAREREALPDTIHPRAAAERAAAEQAAVLRNTPAAATPYSDDAAYLEHQRRRRVLIEAAVAAQASDVNSEQAARQRASRIAEAMAARPR